MWGFSPSEPLAHHGLQLVAVLEGIWMLASTAPEKFTRLLTPDDVAILLGVSRLSVIRQSRKGEIPAIKLGKVYRYRASTLQAWLQQREGRAN
jgi:excisionase family DNA binding protein